MSQDHINPNDARIEKILMQLVKYSQGEFALREKVSDNGDVLDAIIIGLNTLGEEASASGRMIKDYEKRAAAIMEVLLKYTLFDFSEKIEISPAQDELDAIAIGLNTMAEELISSRTNEKAILDQITQSEEKFRILVGQVKDYAIVMVDLDENISSWNVGAENIKGYTAQEIVGKPLSIFYTDKDIIAKEAQRNLQMTRENGRYETQGWRRKRDGSLFWADIIYTALHDDTGKLKGYSKVTRDITEQKRAEDNLRETNQFLDTIIENIPHMVFVKEAKELRFVRFNTAGEELLGISRDTLIGRNDYDLFPIEQADFFTNKDRETLAKKVVLDIPEEVIQTANGERWLHTKKIPILDNLGLPAYLLGISEDITERKAKDEKIKNLNVDLNNNVNLLQSINDELEAFTYSVSHDLRAPLRAIHGFTKIIESDYISKLDDDAKGMMKHVMDNAKKMGQLIDDLLALSRFSKKELQKKPIDITKLVHQCLAELEKTVDVSKATIVIDDLGMARVDPALMFQVFLNLLSNAVKYSSLIDKPVIHVGCEPGLDETIYYVKDNGTGFDMKYYDKLFGVFQRLHSAEEFEGTGVGLALIKRIVTRHNGRVWAEAELGKGASFYIAMNTGH